MSEAEDGQRRIDQSAPGQNQGDRTGPNRKRPVKRPSVNDSVELDHFKPIDVPRWVLQDASESYTRQSLPECPIPAKPLHLCPACDYNLTGLTSRRCPECGQPFTLSEARQRALEKSPEYRQLYGAARMERWMVIVGVGLLIAAVVLPNLSFSGTAPYVVFQWRFRTWVVVAFLMILAVTGLLTLYQHEVTLPQVILGLGLVAIIVSVVFSIL